MKFIFSIIISVLLCNAALAQNLHNISADKIVGVIGSRYIAMSDVDNFFSMQKESNDTLGSEAKCEVMMNFVSQKILVEMAYRDSVAVGEEEVDAELNDRIQANIRNFGSREMMEQRLGKSVYQIKEEYRDEIREQLTASRMQELVTADITVTPLEVQKSFEEIASDNTLPYIPASVEIGQIIVNPKANEEVELYTRGKLEEVRQQIVTGEREFSVMAGIVSEDPGSRNEGGLVEITNKESFDPAFVSAAFRLQEGEISPVFRSSYGYHIILMEKRDLSTAIVRHILMVPTVTSVEINALIAELDSVKTELENGKLSYGEAVNKISNDDMAKSRSGMMFNRFTGSTQLTLDQLDQQTVEIIKDMKVGEYSAPHVFQNIYQNGNPAVRILFLKTRIDPHTADITTDYTLFQNVALQEKKYKILNDYVYEQAKTMHIRLDPMYEHCESLKPFYKQQSQKSAP